ncbi:hypothetical protein FQR65_LT15190 [Abscondita terminalis]|nr:hypothetical protein FQR65_LT15190 [Abscondita terminalis]
MIIREVYTSVGSVKESKYWCPFLGAMQNYNMEEIEKISLQIRQIVVRYGLDGINFDDEYQSYNGIDMPVANNYSYTMLIKRCKELMPDKIVSFYNIGTTPQVANGSYSRKIIWIMPGKAYYGSYYAPFVPGLTDKKNWDRCSLDSGCGGQGDLLMDGAGKQRRKELKIKYKCNVYKGYSKSIHRFFKRVDMENNVINMVYTTTSEGDIFVPPSDGTVQVKLNPKAGTSTAVEVVSGGEAAVNSYNTANNKSYTLLPASNYSITSGGTAVFEAGQRQLIYLSNY